MNTKLNMGVIEDKSITYSKLADDVAESITATMTGSTPDWNAKEGEAGYIENRTHYAITDRLQLPSEAENYEINFGSVAGRDAILNFYVRGGFITEVIKFDDISEHVISRAGATIKIKRKNIGDTGFYITTSSSFSDDEYIENQYIQRQLSDYYIPDTIARTKDVTALEARIAELEAKLNAITITVDK